MVQSKKLAVNGYKMQVGVYLAAAEGNEIKKSICQLMHADLQATLDKLVETEERLTRLLIGTDSCETKITFLTELAPYIEKLKALP